MPQVNLGSSTWSLAQRALACSKPRCRTLEQITVIADMLTQLAVFEGVDRDDLLAMAYFMEAKHSEAGECVLSKGQPLEQWCLLLHGSAQLTRYSAQRGSEQVASPLGPNDSWSEAALLHSTHPRRSSVTVVAGPQGCMTLRLRYSDYDAMNDMRYPLQLLPPEGTQGPPAELTLAQRRAANMALLCCSLRRLASARPPDERTPEEASELEPFFASLPAYRTYPPELVACLAAACRFLSLPPGSIVYEHSTLADAQVTVLSGEVQLRRFGGLPGMLGEDGEGEGSGVGGGGSAAAAGAGAAAAVTAAGAAATSAGPMRPAPPPGQKPGTAGAAAGSGAQAQEGSAEGSGGRLNIRARLRREREARKLMQKQLDEYVSRLDADTAAFSAASSGAGAISSGENGKRASGTIKDPASASHIDWTRVFMQKAMRTVEPVWKALHPADKAPRRRQAGGDNAFDIPLDGSEGPITEVAQLLGPAAAKAYYRGLQTQGYSEDSELPLPSPSGGSGSSAPAKFGEPGGGGGGGDASARERWRRWMFSVDRPETEKQRNLRSMAMGASRINRERHARSRGRGCFDAEEMEEMYGPQFTTLSRGSSVGELSTVMLHSAMRKESAVAGPGGCELLLVDWEAYQQGVLAARAAVLARAAGFFSSLPKERLSQLAELCLCLTVDAWTLLARQGNLLECMVVVQDGEVILLHEPSAALHTRISTFRGLAVSGSRNGRTQLLPLLATLSAAAPGVGGSGSTAAAASAGGSGGAAGAVTVPPAPAASGGSFTSSSATPVEISLQGLPLGEVGVGGILGETVLGARGGGGAAASAPTSAVGHADHSHHGLGHRQVSAHAAVQGHTGMDSHQSPLTVVPPASVVEGPKWPTTVLASRASVLLVMPRSVLYMAEFDLVRGELIRFAAERRTWLARRVEAAYRDAAAPPTTPAVFTTAGGTSGITPVGGAAQPQPQPPPHPSPRRPAEAGGVGGSGPSAPRIGSFPRRAVSGDITGSGLHATAGGGGVSESGGGVSASPHNPISRRKSVESLLQRSPSPNNTAAAAAAAGVAAAAGTPTSIASPGGGTAAAGGGGGGGVIGILSRPNSKWDFLDGPTSATGAAAAASGGGSCAPVGTEMSAPVLVPASSSLPRGTGAGGGLSLLDSTGSVMLSTAVTLTGSFTSGSVLASAGGSVGGSAGGAIGVPPLRRPSSGNLRALRDSAAAAASSATVPTANGGGGGGGGANGMEWLSLSPVQQALLEVGLDPLLASGDVSYGPGGGLSPERHGFSALNGVTTSGGVGAGGSGSSVAALPALTPSGAGAGASTPRGLAPLIAGGGGAAGGNSFGVSPVASIDFDAMRAAGLTTHFRSTNALTPTRRRSHCGGPGGLPAVAPMSLLDPGYGTVGNGGSGSSGVALIPSVASATANSAAPSVRVSRATTQGGMGTGVRRRTDMDGGLAAVAAQALAVGALTAPAPPPSLPAPRVPSLQALDVLEIAVAAVTPPAGPSPMPSSVPSSPGLYSRSSRNSYTGGMTLRMSSADVVWMHGGGSRGGGGLSGGSGSGFAGGPRGRGAMRDGGGSGGYAVDAGLAAAATDVEAEEEVLALARSLVPKNQAGMFMVRGGVASTPAKQPAARRIAGCF